MHSLRLHHLGPNLSAENHIPKPQYGLRNNETSKFYRSSPEDNTFADALRSIRISIDDKNPKLGSCIHARTLKLGLENCAFIANSLLHMYVKCGQIDDAANLFDEMSCRNVVSWTSMMWGYCQVGSPDKVLVMFSQMVEDLKPNEYALAVVLQACGQKGHRKLVQSVHGYAVKCGIIVDSYFQSCLLDAYVKCGMMDVAEMWLGRFSCRDVISWTTVISGCVRGRVVDRAFMLFYRMQEEGVLPNEVTILSMLQACSETENRKVFHWGHGLVLKGGWCTNGFIVNSLVEMYCTNGCFHEGVAIFCHFSFSNKGLYLSAEAIANLIHGCTSSGLFQIGKEIHGYLIKHGYVQSNVVENSLMNMYAENGDDNSPLLIFTRIRNKDIVSWNTMIRCFAENGQPSEALDLLTGVYRDGPQDGVFIDFVTILASLQACSDLASLEQGQVIHGCIFKKGLLQDLFVQNSVIDMYAKSGRLDFAEKIFKEMHERDVGSYNSMIAAYGINGNGTSALCTFADLSNSEVCRPNSITFTNILSACAHAGLVEEGLKIFYCLDKNHGIEPRAEHFACVVNLLGRSGRIEEAEAFIEKMSLKPNHDLWGALLGACVLKGNVEVAERAASMLAILEPENSIWRVALSNVYASLGRWHDVAKVRKEISVSAQLKKEGGWSIVDLQGRSYRFMVGDTMHPDSRMIYEVLNRLQNQLRDLIIDNTIALID